MFPEPFRPAPHGPVQAYKTFAVNAPLETHWRKATCEEIGCGAYLNGWITRAATQEQADYIRRHSGRKFEVIGPDAFKFAPGQTCFRAAEHKIRIDRPEIYVVRGGDWRCNPTGERRVHTSADFWVEEFAEHQDLLVRRLERDGAVPLQATHSSDRAFQPS